MTVGDSESEVFSCRYDPTDKYVAAGFGDGAIRIYNTLNGKCSFTLCSAIDQWGKSGDMPVTSLRWRPANSKMKTANVLVASTADGLLKHWHATSGKCLSVRRCEDNLDQQLYTIDFNTDGSLLATAGKDKYVRLYDEQTKGLVLKMKEGGERFPGHSNRIFAVKFNQNDPNVIASGGWDNTVQIYDIRRRGPVASMYGPHICGEAIDFRSDGTTLLTGSYRGDDVLELWDLRKYQKFRTIDWDGPKSEQLQQQENEKKEEDKENEPPAEEELPIANKAAPFIYTCMFNNTTNMVMAGGAGSNQVRLFDYDTGSIVCMISDLPKAVICMSKANTSNEFVFGSVDSKIRFISQKDVVNN
jgi:COMPASS component SWD3